MPVFDTTFTEMYSCSAEGGVGAKWLRVTRTLASLGQSRLPERRAVDLNGTFTSDDEGRMGGDPMLQLTQLTSPGWNIEYNFSPTQNNGKIVSQTDVVSAEQVTYAYDSLTRLLSGSSNQNWSQTFSYDGFGNLTNVTGVNAPGLGVAYNPATNQQTTDCADANGNVFGNATCAGANAYSYDILNRQIGVPGGMQYSYSLSNQRVWRGNGSTVDEVTLWGPTGQKLGTYQLSVSNGQLAATQTGVNCYFGSKLIKNASGWVYQDRWFAADATTCDYDIQPFSQNWSCNGVNISFRL